MSIVRRNDEAVPFLVLPENRLAVAAVEQLLSSELPKTSSQHLLTLIGPPGCGKSTLIRHALKSLHSNQKSRIILVTVAEFAAQFAEAVDTQSEHQFQIRYRKNIDLLLCEDLQALSGRTETQQQFQFILDNILAHDGKCLVTTALSPGSIPRLSQKLVNRLHGGVSVDIEPPGPESRHLLAHHFASAMQLTLTEAAAREIASRTESPRDILGLLQRVRHRPRSQRRPIVDVEDLSAFDAEDIPDAAVTLADIASQTAREFEIALTDLRGPSRSQCTAMPRQMAMFLARELTGQNLAEIGRYFGNRNHNTVLYACRRIESQVKENMILAQHMLNVRQALKPRRSLPPKSTSR